MRELTDEQERAVGRRSESLLLAAGAGSGKTSVLVERFVRAVREDGVAPARILAITFTERAAAELRERVRTHLLELGEREAARDTEAAYVATVHGFCARLLRTHALSVGLDPAFTVLDEPRAARLRGVAFARALTAFLEGPRSAPAVDLAAAYGADRLQATIVAVHEELRSRGQRTPALPAGVLARGGGPGGDAAGTDSPPVGGSPGVLDARAIASPPAGGSSRALDAAATALDRAARIAVDELEIEYTRRPGRRLEDGLAALQQGRELVQRCGPLTGDATSSAPLPGRLAALMLPAANGGLGGPACDAYRQALAAFAGACADHHAIGAYALLGELLRGYTVAYADLKRGRGAVDFDDLELEARDLLERDEGARRSWSERFELLMVDEFQDTNPRQLAILRRLERGNLFTVGDEFQSIYGFRHADVSLFRTRRAELATRSATLALARNFRGRAPLLDVINAVFAPRFGADFTPLVAGREEPAPATEPLVELLLTDTRDWDGENAPDLGDTLPPAARWRQAEARMLAQRVADLIASGQASAGGVAVLVRATGDIPVYERALEERGLATLAAGAGGYWSHQQVNDLLAYIGALANPLDERALYSTLASPLVGISSDGMALLSHAASAAGAGPWGMLRRAFVVAHPQAGDHGGGELDSAAPFDAGDGVGRGGEVAERAAVVCATELAAALSAPDRERLAEFCPRLAAERRDAPRHAISVLLERAIEASGYERFVLGLRWGGRRLANVHKLLRLARSFEASEGRDLRGFLDHAARQAGAAAREADAPVEDAELDAVRLMTIHAAKGLEFGVVAVADLGRQGRTDVPDLLVDGERVGLRLQALDGSGPTPALAFAQLREERLAAEAREEERILYVAMTRARERLLLSGAVNVERWPTVRAGAPALGWLGPALVEDLPACLDPASPFIELSPPGAAHARVLCWLNAPSTVGGVLREDSLREAVGVSREVSGGEASVDAAPAGGVSAGEAWLRNGSPGRAPRGDGSSGQRSLRGLAASWTSSASADVAPGGGGRELAFARAPEAISYTSLAEFERCGYRYYLERVLGLLPVEAPGAREHAEVGALEGRVRGALVHRLLESLDYARPRAPAPEEVARIAAELGASPDARECRQIAQLVAAVAATELGARLAGAARVHREHPFAFLLGPGEPLLTGVVDAIAHELDGGCLIVDYKSDRARNEDLGSLTERAYGIQRRIYALAALRSGALEVEVVHWYLERPDEPVRARYGAGEADGLAAELRDRLRNLTAARFAVSPRPHRELCDTCPGRSGLCTWSESETMRPRAALEAPAGAPRAEEAQE